MSEDPRNPEENPNPIDPDKVSENPHNLPYAHHVGSAVIKPEDKGKIKGRALAAMAQQTEQQLGQIYEQMQLLAKQANEIKSRVEVSQKVYEAEMQFDPLMNEVYHLYLRKSGKHILTMVSPDEWGRSMPYEAFVASVRLMADHTWEVIEDGGL